MLEIRDKWAGSSAHAATGQEGSATLNTITNSEELGLPAGSWWKLVVEGSMLEIVRPVLELLWVSWALGRDGNNSLLYPGNSQV